MTVRTQYPNIENWCIFIIIHNSYTLYPPPIKFSGSECKDSFSKVEETILSKVIGDKRNPF